MHNSPAPARAAPARLKRTSLLFSGQVSFRDLREGSGRRRFPWCGPCSAHHAFNIASFLGPLWRPRSGALGRAGQEPSACCSGLPRPGAVVRRLRGWSGASARGALARARLADLHLGIAVSTWLPVTLVLEFAETASLTASMVASGAITIASVPEAFRGRIFGVYRSMAVALIPISALVGGWIAEFVEIWIMFAAGGVFVLALALAAWANPHVRTARI